MMCHFLQNFEQFESFFSFFKQFNDNIKSVVPFQVFFDIWKKLSSNFSQLFRCFIKFFKSLIDFYNNFITFCTLIRNFKDISISICAFRIFFPIFLIIFTIFETTLMRFKFFFNVLNKFATILLVITRNYGILS